MKFLTLPVDEAAGCVLAHSQRTASGRIAKGAPLGDDEIRRLKESGISQVAVAQIEAGDVAEDEAAAAVAAGACGARVESLPPAYGRSNLRAACAGVLLYDAAALHALNGVDPAVTVAALAPYSRVEEGRIVATVKIIPFAAKQESVDRAAAAKPDFAIAPFSIRRAALVQTRLPSVAEGVLDKTAEITRRRLALRGAVLAGEWRCEHGREAVAEALRRARRANPQIILLAGASAACDEEDEIPAAIAGAGGDVQRFGMPVDPGNLLVLAEWESMPCVVMPGCARSPKINGFDWVLDRLCAGLRVRSEDVAAMGAGGLLDDVSARPFRQDPAVGALLLAAGGSRRMGGENKLLRPWRGMPLVRHAAQTLAAACDQSLIRRAIVVCGRDAEQVKDALRGLDLPSVENAAYGEGVSSSLICGLDALNADSLDGALVMLGDMPLVTVDDVRAVVKAFAPGDGIVAAAHRSKRGNPVIVGRRHFAALRDLKGDAGARTLFASHPVEQAEAGSGVLFDMDSPEAFEE